MNDDAQVPAAPVVRYMAELSGQHVLIYCEAHPVPPLLTLSGPLDEYQTEIAEAVEIHERERHAEAADA